MCPHVPFCMTHFFMQSPPTGMVTHVTSYVKSAAKGSCFELALTPLRCSTSRLKAEFLALLGARVAFEEAAHLEVFALLRNEFGHCTGKTHTHGFCLRLESPTRYFC